MWVEGVVVLVEMATENVTFGSIFAASMITLSKTASKHVVDVEAF